MNMFNFSLPAETIEANKAFYIATLKHLFLERGRSMSQTYLIRRTINGTLDKYSKPVLLLGPDGLEPGYYNFDTEEWVRMPSNQDKLLLLKKYIEPEWGLEELANKAVFNYMVGKIRVTEVAIKTSHIYK